jgi:hypothetical protein
MNDHPARDRDGGHTSGVNYGNAPGSNFGTAHNSDFRGTINNYGDPAQQEELRALIAGLQAAVARYHHQLADPQGATTAVEMLQEEARGEQRPNRLTSFLAMLTASAGGVTAITEAAAKAKELIASML